MLGRSRPRGAGRRGFAVSTPSPAMVVALLALVFAMTGTGIAAKTMITGKQIKDGTITAVGGGAMRDLLLRRVPAVFGGNALYATVAVAASAAMVVASYAGAPSIGIIVAIVSSLGLRWGAVRRGAVSAACAAELRGMLYEAKTRTIDWIRSM